MIALYLWLDKCFMIWYVLNNWFFSSELNHTLLLDQRGSFYTHGSQFCTGEHTNLYFKKSKPKFVVNIFLKPQSQGCSFIHDVMMNFLNTATQPIWSKLKQTEKKSRVREKKHLSTNPDSNTDTTKPRIFWKTQKIMQNAKFQNV